jgi:aminomuconate-semialdehyde/2-hydroxymuconate-6-semialdehyde dehydrogenase
MSIPTLHSTSEAALRVDASETIDEGSVDVDLSGMDCLHFIDGKRVASRNNKSFENVNPATEEVLGSVAQGGAAEVDMAVEAAHKAFVGGWKNTKPSERAAILRKISDLILQRKDELAMLESLDTGKPLWLATNVDIPRAAGNYQFFANLISTMGRAGLPTQSNRSNTSWERGWAEALP